MTNFVDHLYPMVVYSMHEWGDPHHMLSGQLKPSSFQIINVAGNKQRNIGLCTPTHGVSSLGSSGNNSASTLLSLVMARRHMTCITGLGTIGKWEEVENCSSSKGSASNNW
ncbi:hypothetical protein Taro_034133 [Colocasia esculenta]|uniref:Uncharacterized protein n=1 Tax=Colocasia esculenta TaxID=4460 RepID=A0A843VQH1_COLES|nr:hypothetical protein [Colocasia esculenta]